MPSSAAAAASRNPVANSKLLNSGEENEVRGVGEGCSSLAYERRVQEPVNHLKVCDAHTRAKVLLDFFMVRNFSSLGWAAILARYLQHGAEGTEGKLSTGSRMGLHE